MSSASHGSCTIEIQLAQEHSMFRGFRDFLLRGNVVDLAVAVVIGTAFTAVVTAFTRALLQPLINLVLGGGVRGGQVVAHGQTFDFGGMLNALITFVLIAAVVYYVVVVPTRRISGTKAAPEDETVLLAQIRDLLQRQGKSLDGRPNA
jgi:large conductance mechanosensitive channel